MEIEIGEYVRTRDGKIGKIIDITNITGQTRKKYLVKCDIDKAYYITTIRIIKHSKNIIDIIEVGDYVNGKEVLRINDYEDFKRADFNLDYDDTDAVYNDDIKSIATKEQLSNIEYKVEE